MPSRWISGWMCGATQIYRRHVLSQRLLILLGLDVGDPDLGEQHAAPPGPLRGGVYGVTLLGRLTTSSTWVTQIVASTWVTRTWG